MEPLFYKTLVEIAIIGLVHGVFAPFGERSQLAGGLELYNVVVAVEGKQERKGVSQIGEKGRFYVLSRLSKNYSPCFGFAFSISI